MDIRVSSSVHSFCTAICPRLSSQSNPDKGHRDRTNGLSLKEIAAMVHHFDLDPTKTKADFDRDGFVVLREFLSPPELAELQQELHRYLSAVVPNLPPKDVMYEDKQNPQTLKQL